ncbi:hypothetical protein Gogos_021568 [Gossypium gossypioides]|uniref:RNase H type-1 domain-containing protein n=1 Tax=Gossypium gossypioides TaxID=34282 RepID=A0A7J9D0S2_GOSGO|nr:hypothetical protein [Gossypium gossypioides]
MVGKINSQILSTEANVLIYGGHFLRYGRFFEKILHGLLEMEMVNSDGSWNLDLFRAWVSEDIINRIISIPPPHPDSGSDRIIWSQSTFGVFSDYGLMWSCLFGLVAWRIWKNRNLFIFQHISWSASEVVKVSSCWNRHYTYHVGDHFNNKQGSYLMVNSDENWVFLFTDGAVARDSSYAATGGVALDRDGNWIVGFNRFLGMCSPFEADVWAILDGILILFNKGYKRIIIMIDNLEVGQILTDMDLEDSGITVL